MPRDNDKNNDSRGRRDRPSGGKGRSGAARGPEKKFAKRGFAGKDFASKSDSVASGVPMPASPTAPNPTATSPMARSPIRARASLTPASAKAPRRASTGMMRRAAKSAPTPRAPIAAMPARPRDFPTGNSATRNLMHRATAAARNGPLRRAVKASARTATAPQGDRPYRARPPRDGDRPRGDRPERKFGGDKKFSRGAPDRGPRKDFGSRDRKSAPGIATRPRRIQSRGRSVMPARPITSDATRVRRATVHEASTSRVSKSPVMTSRVRIVAATSVRAFRARARIVPRVTSSFRAPEIRPSAPTA